MVLICSLKSWYHFWISCKQAQHRTETQVLPFIQMWPYQDLKIDSNSGPTIQLLSERWVKAQGVCHFMGAFWKFSYAKVILSMPLEKFNFGPSMNKNSANDPV